jgi:Ca2+-binding EF-hand superfamily protein
LVKLIFKTCALKIDTDRSGEISINELSKIIKHLEFDCVDDEVREIMNLLDKNGVCLFFNWFHFHFF